MIMVGHIVCGNVRFLTPLGGIGVALFLILSGYGLSESFAKKGLAHYWSNKFLRVCLPYIIVYNIVNIVSGSCSLADTDYWLNVLCLRTDFWYVSYQMYCYAAFWLAFRFIDTNWARVAALVVCGAISFVVLPEIESEQSLSFVCGVCISLYGRRLRSYMDKYAGGLMLLFLIWGIAALAVKQLPLVRVYEGMWIYDMVQMNIKLPIAIGFLLLIHKYENLYRFRLLPFAGLISYELYLVHFPLYTQVGSSLPRAAALFGGSFLIAWIFHKFNTVIAAKLRRV